jgi:hypothetical protein
MCSRTFTLFLFLQSQLLNTDESSIPTETVADCMDAVFLSADLGNVSSDMDDDPDLYGLYQASGGRILFAI